MDTRNTTISQTFIVHIYGYLIFNRPIKINNPLEIRHSTVGITELPIVFHCVIYVIYFHLKNYKTKIRNINFPSNLFTGFNETECNKPLVSVELISIVRLCWSFFIIHLWMMDRTTFVWWCLWRHRTLHHASADDDDGRLKSTRTWWCSRGRYLVRHVVCCK